VEQKSNKNIQCNLSQTDSILTNVVVVVFLIIIITAFSNKNKIVERLRKFQIQEIISSTSNYLTNKLNEA